MAGQFDVFANPDAHEAARRPYLLVLQSDLVSGLNSVVVAPLISRNLMQGAERLNPLLTVEGRQYWLAMQELFAVDRRALRRAITNLGSDRQAIIAALDLLFTGF